MSACLAGGGVKRDASAVGRGVDWKTGRPAGSSWSRPRGYDKSLNQGYAVEIERRGQI